MHACLCSHLTVSTCAACHTAECDDCSKPKVRIFSSKTGKIWANSCWVNISWSLLIVWKASSHKPCHDGFRSSGKASKLGKFITISNPKLFCMLRRTMLQIIFVYNSVMVMGRASSSVRHKWHTIAQLRGTMHMLSRNVLCCSYSLRRAAFPQSFGNPDSIYSVIFSSLKPVTSTNLSMQDSWWNLLEEEGWEVTLTEANGKRSSKRSSNKNDSWDCNDSASSSHQQWLGHFQVLHSLLGTLLLHCTCSDLSALGVIIQLENWLKLFFCVVMVQGEATQIYFSVIIIIIIIII